MDPFVLNNLANWENEPSYFAVMQMLDTEVENIKGEVLNATDFSKSSETVIRLQSILKVKEQIKNIVADAKGLIETNE
jgi:hypothetical protein